MPHLMFSQGENKKNRKGNQRRSPILLISIWEDAVVSQIHQRDHWTGRWSDWYGDQLLRIWSMVPRPNPWSETCLTSASLPGNKSKTMMMMINAIFKMISFRNGNRCKYGGSHHKSILLARSHTAHANVQPRLEIGIKAERVCDIVTLWHSRWRSSAYIWMLLFSFSFSIYAPFLQLSLQGHGSRNSLLKSWKTSNSSFFPSLAWVGQILRRSDYTLLPMPTWGI